MTKTTITLTSTALALIMFAMPVNAKSFSTTENNIEQSNLLIQVHSTNSKKKKSKLGSNYKKKNSKKYQSQQYKSPKSLDMDANPDCYNEVGSCFEDYDSGNNFIGA